MNERIDEKKERMERKLRSESKKEQVMKMTKVKEQKG